MGYRKGKRPADQSNGRNARSNCMLAQFGGFKKGEAVACAALVLFLTVILPRLMYLAIAPAKGWM